MHRWVHRQDDAFTPHNPYRRAFFERQLALAGAGLPVVTVNGHPSEASGLDGLAHHTLAPHHGVDIAQPLLVVRLFQQPHDERTHKYNHPRCHNRQRKHLHVEAAAQQGHNQSAQRAHTDTKQEKSARSHLDYDAQQADNAPEYSQFSFHFSKGIKRCVNQLLGLPTNLRNPRDPTKREPRFLKAIRHTNITIPSRQHHENPFILPLQKQNGTQVSAPAGTC